MVHQVSFFACAILSLCCLQIQAISLQRLNTNGATSDLSELEQFLASMNVESGRKSANGTAPIPTNALSDIISGLISGFTMAITPSLGPLGPLVTIGAPLANSAITGLFTNALTELGELLHRKDQHGHKINIPNRGSYFMMSNNPELAVPSTNAQQSQIKNLFGNQEHQIQLFTGLQNMMKSLAFMDNQQPAFGQGFQQKNNIILVPLHQMNGLNGINGLQSMLANQQGRSISSDENFLN